VEPAVRHCSLFSFKTGTADAVIDEIVHRFRALAREVPAIRRAAIGRNIGFHEENYDIAANIEFDTIDGYREYCVDQTHLAFVDEWLLPHLESRVAVQFELDNIAPDPRA
jgi:hypothetical protein